MTEKMFEVIEAALWRVLGAALHRTDLLYPNRDQDDFEYLQHLQCVQSVISWYQMQVVALRKMRISRRPARPPRQASTNDIEPDWDLLLEIFEGPGDDDWMMSIALSALPYELRVMLVRMGYVVEVAMVDADKCGHELLAVAELLRAERRRMGGKRISAVPGGPDLVNRQKNEARANVMAERFKNLLKPSAPSPLPKRSLRP